MPSHRKQTDARCSIYRSRSLDPLSGTFGLPVLCDFGEARIGVSHPYEYHQPNQYRSPEMMMEGHWDSKFDMWSLASVVIRHSRTCKRYPTLIMQVWELLGAVNLFDGHDEGCTHSNRQHMWEIVCLLGLPPKEFLERS